MFNYFVVKTRAFNDSVANEKKLFREHEFLIKHDCNIQFGERRLLFKETSKYEQVEDGNSI